MEFSNQDIYIVLTFRVSRSVSKRSQRAGLKHLLNQAKGIQLTYFSSNFLAKAFNFSSSLSSSSHEAFSEVSLDCADVKKSKVAIFWNQHHLYSLMEPNTKTVQFEIYKKITCSLYRSQKLHKIESTAYLACRGFYEVQKRKLGTRLLVAFR